MPNWTLRLRNFGSVLQFLLLIVMPLACLFEMRELSANPMMFPAACSVIILIVGLKTILFSPPAEIPKELANIRTIFKIIIVLLIFCGLLEVIGFYAATFLLSCYFYRHFDSHNKRPDILFCISVSLVITVVMYLFIFYILQLQMQECILF